MSRKLMMAILIFVFSLLCVSTTVLAYNYQDSSHSKSVDSMITEIYDSKQQYLDLVGTDYQETTQFIEASSDSYWWPIGSVETVTVGNHEFAKGDPETVRTTSPFGYRTDPFTGAKKFHSGLDIAGGRGAGQVNVIAARDGIVVYPTSGVANDCPTSNSQSSCGGGYGNYVIIQHTDGNYTLYAHLYEHSITVVAGDSVSQGQVIAKMGSSGNSTGAHLHFEVREGQNAYSATVDPLNYISASTPRVININFDTATGGEEDEFLHWLISMEGHSKIIGDCYLVEDIGDGVRSVGSGVTLENNPTLFAERGIDINKYPVGSKIPIKIVDSIMGEIVGKQRSYVERTIANNSITLNASQINALTSQLYNIGNIKGFVDAYKKYGNTQALFDNWLFRATMPGSKFEAGLTRRRKAEWKMFHEGLYVMGY